MKGWIVVNGEILPLDQGKIDPLDRGFLFGDSVFETLVAFRGAVLDWLPHFQRLVRSSEYVKMTIPYSEPEFLFLMEEVLGRADFPKASIRIVVTRGSNFSLGDPAVLKPNTYIYCTPAPITDQSFYQYGIKVGLKKSTSFQRGSLPKTSNYLASILAIEEAKRSGYDDVVWTNQDDELTEASSANLFLIGRQGDSVEIVTPPARCGILLGITRARLIELLNRARIPVTERVVDVREVPGFDEAFVCSTVKGLIPVQALGDHKLHSARSKSVFRHIERLFKTWVRSEVGMAVDWSTGAPLDSLP